MATAKQDAPQAAVVRSARPRLAVPSTAAVDALFCDRIRYNGSHPLANHLQTKASSMARYQMKQKWLSWGDDYTITDAQGQPAFFVDGRALSLGAKLSLQDMQHNELAFISQKLLSWGPTFEIHRAGQLVAVVKKSIFTLLRAEFTVDVPGPDDLVAQGNFWDYEYAFTRHGNQVAQVSKAWFAMTDTYGVDVADGEDDVLILAAVVVIDQCRHERRDSD